MEMLSAVQRRAARHAVTVTCQVVHEPAFALLGERGFDLSTHGMLLQSKAFALPGDPIIATFRVPGTDRWVDTLGTVARVVRGRRWGDMGPTMGIAFAELSVEDNLLIRWALRRVAPPLPSRPMRIDYAATAAMVALAYGY